MNMKEPKGATPLSPDEFSGLIPKVITTHGELNRLEQKNILARAFTYLVYNESQIAKLIRYSFQFFSILFQYLNLISHIIAIYNYEY